MAIKADERNASKYPITLLLLKRSIITMIVVGTILNLINQTGGLMGADPINWWRFFLTYLVPFGVSIVSGVLTLQECNEQHK